MATRVFNGIKFCEHFFKRTSQGTFLPSLVQIGPAVWEEKMFKKIVADARQTHHHPKSSPWAHCELKRVTHATFLWIFFQNLTCGFREEDLLRTSLCLNSTSSPNSQDPSFFTDQNFGNYF